MMSDIGIGVKVFTCLSVVVVIITLSTYTFLPNIPTVKRYWSIENLRRIILMKPKSSYKVYPARLDELDSNSSDEELWNEMMVERFSSRREILRTYCHEYGRDLTKMLYTTLNRNFYYARKYELFACIIAKGGTSTWKHQFLLLNGYEKNFTNPHDNKLRKVIAAKALLTKKEFDNVMYGGKNVTRVMSVRHPFTRLVSAYRSKYYNGEPITFKRSDDRMRFYKEPLKFMGISLKGNDNITVAFPFPIFVRHVLAEKARGIGNMNLHWRPYSSSCGPCSIQYDYIIKLETFDDDVGYLIKTFGLSEMSTELHRNRSPENSTLNRSRHYGDYLKEIPLEHLKELYQLYKTDFRLFDYRIPLSVLNAYVPSQAREIDSYQPLIF